MDFRRLCDHEPIFKKSPLDITLEYDWASPELYTYLLKHRWYGMARKDARSDDNYAFREATVSGNLDILIWLTKTFGLTIEDARSCNNCAFRWANNNRHLDVLEFLESEFGITGS